MANIQIDMVEWKDIIHGLVNDHNGNNIDSVVKRLILAASVYCIWNERNCRIFNDENKSAEEVANRILEIVKMKLMSLKVKESPAVKKVERLWSIAFKRRKVSIENMEG